MNLIVWCGAKTVVARLQPFQAHEGEPAIRLLEFDRLLRTPSGELVLPRGVLRADGSREQRAYQAWKQDYSKEVVEPHSESIE